MMVSFNLESNGGRNMIRQMQRGNFTGREKEMDKGMQLSVKARVGRRVYG